MSTKKRFRVFYYVDVDVDDDEDVEKDVKPQLIAEISEPPGSIHDPRTYEVVSKLGFDIAEVPIQ